MMSFCNLFTERPSYNIRTLLLLAMFQNVQQQRSVTVLPVSSPDATVWLSLVAALLGQDLHLQSNNNTQCKAWCSCSGITTFSRWCCHCTSRLSSQYATFHISAQFWKLLHHFLGGATSHLHFISPAILILAQFCPNLMAQSQNYCRCFVMTHIFSHNLAKNKQTHATKNNTSLATATVS